MLPDKTTGQLEQIKRDAQGEIDVLTKQVEQSRAEIGRKDELLREMEIKVTENRIRRESKGKEKTMAVGLNPVTGEIDTMVEGDWCYNEYLQAMKRLRKAIKEETRKIADEYETKTKPDPKPNDDVPKTGAKK